MTEAEKTLLKKKIITDILGYSQFGFFDHEKDPGKWKDFNDKYFFRSGIVNEGSPNEFNYTATQNKFISGVAVLQTLGEIKNRIEKLFEEIP